MHNCLSCVWGGVGVVVWSIGMNVFGSFQLVKTCKYALCASGAVNTHGFVWKFLGTINYNYINLHLFSPFFCILCTHFSTQPYKHIVCLFWFCWSSGCFVVCWLVAWLVGLQQKQNKTKRLFS